MANGPRKELSFLDRALMNKAATQGGVLNFLGQQPQVTAPVKAQSHADSPPVQLAYITDAEKDLLVKSNIHGSMDGKPNPGPAGIESLDDFFTTPGGGVSGGSTADTGGSVGGGGGGTSAEDYGIQPGMAVSDKGQVFQGTDFVPAPGQADKPGKFVYVGGPKQLELEELARKKLEEAKPEEEEKKKDKKSLTDRIKSVFTMDELQQFTPLMLNTVQTELNKFIELGITNPLKLRSLMMSNIGGGLLGKDQTYSDMEGNIIDPKDALDKDGNLKEGIRYTREGMKDLMKERFGSDIFAALERYAPDIGYTALGGYMPQTSGGLETLAGNATAIKNSDGSYTTADGRIISKEQGEAYNKMVFNARAEIDRMGKNQSGNTQQVAAVPGIPGVPGVPSLPVPPGTTPPDSYPLPGQPPYMPGPIYPPRFMPFPRPIPPDGSKFEKPAYNYYAQSPQYTMRGLPTLNTNEFNENLRRYYG